MFLIYINDIADNIKSFTHLFVDDIPLYSYDSKQTIENTINTDFPKINPWANNWLVKFNPNKTKFLFISNHISGDMNILFHDNILEPCNQHKHIGITQSANSKWTSHIDNICSSVSKKYQFYVNSNLGLGLWYLWKKNDTLVRDDL